MANNFVELLSTLMLGINTLQHAFQVVKDGHKALEVVKDLKSLKEGGAGDNSFVRRFNGFMDTLYPHMLSVADYTTLMNDFIKVKNNSGNTEVINRLNHFLKTYRKSMTATDINSLKTMFVTQDNNVIEKQILFAPMGNMLLSLSEKERRSMITQIFIDGVSTTTANNISKEIIGQYGYTSQTIINMLSIRPIEIWAKFEKYVYEEVVTDPEVLHALTRHNNQFGLHIDKMTLAHNFFVLMINQIAYDVLQENTGEPNMPLVIAKDSSVVKFMDSWYRSADNKERLGKVVAHLTQPESLFSHAKKVWESKKRAEKKLAHALDLKLYI